MAFGQYVNLDFADIQQSIRDYLRANTNLGEVRVSDEIKSSLVNNEPRINNVSVNATIPPDTNEMNCTVQYDITGISSPTQIVDVLLFPARV